MLRTLVSLPRKRQDGMDLCYVGQNFMVTSMPAQGFRRSLYRNRVSKLKKLLEARHSDKWWIFNFRSETSGDYSDEVFYNRVSRFPWPDHSPPPFKLLIACIHAIDTFLAGDRQAKLPSCWPMETSNTLSLDEGAQQYDNRVAVLQCKAGQGRSGTVMCAFLVAHYGLDWKEAVGIFIRSRMRRGFGSGVSIQSQLRYLRYTQRWRDYGMYRDLTIKISSIIVRDAHYRDLGISVYSFAPDHKSFDLIYNFPPEYTPKYLPDSASLCYEPTLHTQVTGDIRLGICHEMVCKKTFGLPIKHVEATAWFNPFFEDHGLFRVQWSEMDGILGSRFRGSKAFSSIEVHWQME